MKIAFGLVGRHPFGAVFVSTLLSTLPLAAQRFDVGSDGSLGDVVITANTTVDLPPDGRLHYRSLTVNSGARLNFRRNARNTPVFILSQGDIVVNGVIDVNGAAGTSTDGGAPGPGGFAGGKPGFGTVPAGDGQGPGGGRRGDNTGDPSTRPGNGAYGSAGRSDLSPFAPTYGNAVLTPMIGGSGGGGMNGSPGLGGGGGGGAILLASNTRIRVAGAIEARGGPGHASSQHFGGGSGGAIRLVALRVEGNGRLDALGNADLAGRGRIRVDTLERDGIAFNFQGVAAVGQNLFALLPVIPRLDTIEVAGTPFAEGSDPGTVMLPFGTSPERTVKIQARDFGRVVPIRVVLTPDSGPRIEVDAQVDNTTANPAVVEVPVTFPVNTRVTVHCWTR